MNLLLLLFFFSITYSQLFYFNILWFMKLGMLVILLDYREINTIHVEWKNLYIIFAHSEINTILEKKTEYPHLEWGKITCVTETEISFLLLQIAVWSFVFIAIFFQKSTRKINSPLLLVEVVLVVGLELHHLWAMSAVIHTHPHNQQSPVHNTQKGSKSKLDQLGHFSH